MARNIIYTETFYDQIDEKTFIPFTRVYINTAEIGEEKQIETEDYTKDRKPYTTEGTIISARPTKIRET